LISSFDQLKVFFRNYIHFYYRTKRFIGLVIFTLLVSSVVLVLQVSGYIPKSAVADGYASNFMQNIGVTVLLSAAFLGGDAIAQDFSSKTGLVILSQPVRRETIMLGRFLAALTATIGVAGVYYLASIAGLLVFFQFIPISILLSFLISIPFAAAALALAFLFSSIFKSGSAAIITTVLIMYLAFPTVQSLVGFLRIEPWFLLSYASEIITAAIPSQYPPHQRDIPFQTQDGSFTLTTYIPYLWEGLIIMGSYLLITMLLTLILYQRREVK
jgi:ABC-2 type transport system permease protein